MDRAPVILGGKKRQVAGGVDCLPEVSIESNGNKIINKDKQNQPGEL